MKKWIAILLVWMLMFSLTACRRRVTAESEHVEYETVHQPQPVPMEGEGQQVPDGTADPDSGEVQTQTDPNGEHVDEAIAAEGGETTEDAPDAPEAGEKITVFLDAAGGECSKEAVTVRVRGVYGVLPVPEKTGQKFQGWFLSPDHGEPINEVTVVLKETDHTLYAHWTTKTEFLLTFDPNGGRISPYSAEKTIYSGSVYGELPEPIFDGYVFRGWFTQPENGDQIHPADMVTVIDDQTLYAHWEYSPMDYWAFVLKNTTQKIFDCQEMAVYLELEADRVTMPYAPLIEEIGARNIAREEEASLVTDSWAQDKKPNVVVKISDNMGTAEATQTAVERRFPNAKVYVFPLEALEGSDPEQLYYKLRLAALCYPQYYYEIDMDAVAAELGVTGLIHS